MRTHDEACEETYVDGWYCRYCNHGPLEEKDDVCPKCKTAWGEDQPSDQL